MNVTSIRPEIQALRAIAASVVVVCHFWPSALPGGFVGVDVFFVVSGFLITSLLLDELQAVGQIGIAHEGEQPVRDQQAMMCRTDGCQVGDVVGAAPGAGQEVVDLEASPPTAAGNSALAIAQQHRPAEFG